MVSVMDMKKNELMMTLGTVCRNFNKMSRAILKFGIPLIVIEYLAALVFYIIAGRYISYYPSINYCRDFLECAKESIGAVFIGAIGLEMFDLATGKQKEKE